jgi:hypothetical protein
MRPGLRPTASSRPVSNPDSYPAKLIIRFSKWSCKVRFCCPKAFHPDQVTPSSPDDNCMGSYFWSRR